MEGCCDKCGSPIIDADARLKYESLTRFAEELLRGDYGPSLMDSRTMLQENRSVLDFIGAIDSELRKRAKCALSGKYDWHRAPPPHPAPPA